MTGLFSTFRRLCSHTATMTCHSTLRPCRRHAGMLPLIQSMLQHLCPDLQVTENPLPQDTQMPRSSLADGVRWTGGRSNTASLPARFCS